MPEQKLTVKATGEGFAETAAQVEKLAGAEQDLLKKTADAGGASTEASRETEKLRVSNEDLLATLQHVSPALGQAAELMLRGSRIACELGSKHIDLASAGRSAAKAIRENASALKLLAAGGAVVLAISAIRAAVEQMRVEFERATSSIKSHMDPQGELQGRAREIIADVVAVSDRRREGGFTAQQAQAAGQTVSGILADQRYGFVQKGSLADVVGVHGPDSGMEGGGSFSREQLAALAWLAQTNRYQTEAQLSPEARVRKAESALKRYAEIIARVLERHGGEAITTPAIDQAAALTETLGAGSQENIKAFLAGKVPAGADLDKIAKLIGFYVEALAESEKKQQQMVLPGNVGRSGPSLFGSQTRLAFYLEQLAERQGITTGFVSEEDAAIVGQAWQLIHGAPAPTSRPASGGGLAGLIAKIEELIQAIRQGMSGTVMYGPRFYRGAGTQATSGKTRDNGRD